MYKILNIVYFIKIKHLVHYDFLYVCINHHRTLLMKIKYPRYKDKIIYVIMTLGAMGISFIICFY